MREIKFRGKFIDTGEWIYGNLIGKDVIVGEIVEWDSDYFCTEFWQKVNPETVGQYTGLKDRNGKEIYEGDIVWYSDEFNRIAKVELVPECGTGHYIRTSGSGYYALNPSTVKIHDIEVIGNIFENPELLER